MAPEPPRRRGPRWNAARRWWRGLSAGGKAKAATLALLGVAALAAIGSTNATALAFFGGSLLGLAFLFGIVPVVRAAEPLRDLLVSLRPLLLPLIVVVIAGAATLEWWVPAIVAPTLLAAGWLVLGAPEAGGAVPSLSRAWAWVRAGTGAERLRLLIPLGVLVLGVYSLFQLVPSLGTYDRPPFSSTLIALAVIFWVTAVWLRLFGYATTLLRVPLTVLLALTTVRWLMAAGLLPGHRWLSERAEEGGVVDFLQQPGHLLVASGAALAVAAIGELLAERWSALRYLCERGFANRRAETLRGLGFVAAFAATVLIAVAAAIGVASYQRGGEKGVTPQDEVIVAEDVEAVRLPRGGRELARAYMPVLAFTDAERWTPVDVESYVGDPECPAQLVSLYGPGAAGGGGETELDGCSGQRIGEGDPVGETIAGPLPSSCPGLRVPCYQITIHCPQGELACARGETGYDPGAAGPETATAYVRVVTRGRPGDSPGFWRIGPYPEVRRLVQYWYFYRYNEWTRPVLGGHLVQRHEGDWEAVTVGFSDREPLFVGYSAHCGGTWRPWDEVELAPTQEVRDAISDEDAAPAERTLPLIAVAEGSHANYVETEDRRAPDWASCAGLPAGTTTLLSFATNIRDETGDGYRWTPQEVSFVTERDFPMNFPGTWGGNDFTELVNERRQHLGEDHRGPLTPTLQRLWYEPTATIFCSRHWDQPEGFGREGC